MIVDQAWVERNLGFDPIATPAPAATFSFARAATLAASSDDLQREIIDFDSESASGREFLAFTTATGLSRYTDVPWPRGLAPKTSPAPTGRAGSPLPRADVLVVTWTVDEGHALSRVLTPGKDSHNDYRSYTHNYSSISRKMRSGCPALQAKRLGAYWTTGIGKRKVVVFKSDSHMSQEARSFPTRMSGSRSSTKCSRSSFLRPAQPEGLESSLKWATLSSVPSCASIASRSSSMNRSTMPTIRAVRHPQIFR